MENLKNVAPIEDFNWDAYENGESFAGASHEELEKAYDGTLNKVNDREVVALISPSPSTVPKTELVPPKSKPITKDFILYSILEST